MNASNPWRRKFLRLQAVSMMAIVPLLLSVSSQEKPRLSRDQTIEDTRQLAATIESAHPDPYINGGGKIAFHRRLYSGGNSERTIGEAIDSLCLLEHPFGHVAPA